MAVVRARSSPPYGLFAAVAFAVLATGAAVVFYVMWSKSIDEHDKAVARLAKVASDAEQLRVLPALFGTGYDEQHTAIGQLNALVAKANSDLAEARRTITQLTADLAGRQDTVTQVNKLAKSAGDHATALEKSINDSQKTFDTQTATLQDTIKKLSAQIANVGQDRDKAVKDGQAALNDALAKAVDERLRLVRELEDAQSQIAKLGAEIRDLRLRIANFSGNATDVTVGEPDGHVLRVNGTTDEVYINLGRKDHIRPGMPFTAYDPRLGVRFGTDVSAMGNGSIEVLEVGESTSICRITRTTKNRAIQANDLIANLVYHNDRTRLFRFTVFGDFDLDGDGVATAAERDRLIVLIQSWGGQVDLDVTSQTDFLVLGSRPASPMLQESTDTAPATSAATGVVGSVADERSKDQERYDELEIAAKNLAIPVLNQNRFLAMVGYYNTTVVKY